MENSKITSDMKRRIGSDPSFYVYGLSLFRFVLFSTSIPNLPMSINYLEIYSGIDYDIMSVSMESMLEKT